jgi:hypothetical protein
MQPYQAAFCSHLRLINKVTGTKIYFSFILMKDRERYQNNNFKDSPCNYPYSLLDMLFTTVMILPVSKKQAVLLLI